jgi:hypothetical protein
VGWETSRGFWLTSMFHWLYLYWISLSVLNCSS